MIIYKVSFSFRYLKWTARQTLILLRSSRMANMTKQLTETNNELHNNGAHQRVKLPHNVIVKAPGLLPMMYKVSEIAIDLDAPERTLRDWLDAGAPHERDEQQHIWVNGTLFAAWVVAQQKPKRDQKMDDGHAYCLRCNAVVPLVNPITVPMQGKLIMIKGVCATCGCTINRGGRRD
jgi:hypothetical protein